MSRRIHVALIDSGVDPARLPERHRGRTCVLGDVVLPGVRASADEVSSPDELGHGTTNATLLFDASPSIEVTSYRVFGKDHRASLDLVLAALQAALRANVDVICCPLGTPDPMFMSRAAPLIDYCVRAGVRVVAPVSFHGLPAYPGSCEGALGVIADPTLDVDASPRERGIHMAASPLPPSDFPHMAPGASFAAARVAGELARRKATQAS